VPHSFKRLESIKLKKLERRGSFFDIKFNNGVLEIPLLKIGD
jgi:hypothetical protein